MSEEDDPTRSSFEARILEALDQFAVVAKTKKRFSVLSFMEESGISKSSLYADHKYLLPMIRHRLTSMREDANAKLDVISERKPTAADYSALKKESKETLAKLASARLTKAIKELGPTMRDRRQLVLELQEKERIIRQLEKTVGNQQDLLHSMMLQAGQIKRDRE